MMTFISSKFLLVLSVGAVFLVQLASTLDRDTDSEYDNRHLRASRSTQHDEDGMESSLPPLFPLQFRDYLGFAFSFVGLVLAAGGGIGGGGILVPIYVLVMNFPVKNAIGLTAVTVVGGAVANNLLNIPKKHPLHPHRSCIDWDLCLQLIPATIAGALIGAKLNGLLPGTLLVILLLVVLSLTARETLQKAKKMYDKESQTMQQRVANPSVESEKLVKDAETAVEYGATEKSGIVHDPLLAHQDSAFANDQRQQVMKNVCELTGLFIVVTVLNVAKGSAVTSSSQSSNLLGFHCGITCFWTTNVILLLVIFAFAVWSRSELLHRLQTGGPVISDIQWDGKNTIYFPLLAVAGGLVAGLFGLGGGIVMAPLMLALGVNPAVASATNATLILFTVTTAVICFLIFGSLVLDYGLACLLVGFVSTLVGQLVMDLLMKRYNRPSYIAYSISIVVAVSAVCMTIESVIAILKV